LKLAMGALLLTFVTAITAGFLVYQFMFSLTERMKTTFPTQPLQLESIHINNTCITVNIRSSASVNVQITEAYVNGKACSLTETIVISPSSVGIISLYGTYVNGETYTVKITPSLGSPMVFNIKYD